ncbi:unnamed protein product [Phytomonas sp. Hart1]|nr:unnamed protein product [Phytomonas sp. Hart1]|eukprot:CCW70537.1 unnamed protein product [Phytomonas sp. isolate Hart1]
MTHCPIAKTNREVVPVVSAFSGEAKCGSKPPSRVPCCCLDYCTCRFPRRQSNHNKYYHNFIQAPSSRSYHFKDRQSLNKRCLYCLPEQKLIHDDEIANRQQRCRATRSALLKKRRSLKDKTLLSPYVNSYRRNAAELLRILTNKFHQRELDLEYEKRLKELREELKSRVKGRVQRNKLDRLQDMYDSNTQTDKLISDTCKQFPPPCSRCNPRGCESTFPKQESLRSWREPPCHSPRLRPRVPHSDRKQGVSPPMVQCITCEHMEPPPRKLNADTAHYSAKSHLTKKSLQNQERSPSVPLQSGKTPSPGRQGGALAEAHSPRDNKGNCCPSCGHPLTWASATEVVSMLVRGKFNDFFHCNSCGLVAGKPYPRVNNAAGHHPIMGSSIRRSRSMSSTYLRSPFYGRRVLITDDSYLHYRSKLFSEWEKSGAIERVSSTKRSLSASLPDRTQKWRTLPSWPIVVR